MNKSGSGIFSVSKTIVLVGMMGAGKTCIGEILAQRLGLPFVDSDRVVEAEQGAKIAQIFTEQGEAAFREIERETIARLLQLPPCLLSLGGGAFLHEQTRQNIKKTGFSIWLKVEPEIIVARVLRQGHRPILHGCDPRTKIVQLLSEREAFYAMADLTVPCDEQHSADNTTLLQEALLAVGVISC